MILLTISQVLTWILLIAMGIGLLALARQIGVLHERIAPVGALSQDQGPRIGDDVPKLSSHLLNGGLFDIAGPLPDGAKLRLLMFVSATCPICKKLFPIIKLFARSEKVEVVLIGDAPADEQQQMIKRFELQQFPFINEREVGVTFQVGKLPYAVLINGEAKVVAKGLVNSREHLESLVVSHETGFPSIQSYLAAQTSKAA